MHQLTVIYTLIMIMLMSKTWLYLLLCKVFLRG